MSSGTTQLTPQHVSYLSKWRAPLLVLFQTKKNLICFDVLSTTQRNLVIVAQTSQKQHVVYKIASLSGVLQSEILCLTQVSHPSIVHLKEAWSSVGHAFVELEYVPGRCVADMIVESGKLSERKSRQIFMNLVSAVSYLHFKVWVHRDIKPDNIIYDAVTGHSKLIDFELSTRYEKGLRLTQIVGSLRYSSPEMRRQSYEGPEADSWSLGVTLYVLLAAHFPFSDQELLTFKDCRDENVPNVSEEANDLIKQLLQSDANRRLSVDKILNHNWIRKDSKYK